MKRTVFLVLAISSLMFFSCATWQMGVSMGYGAVDNSTIGTRDPDEKNKNGFQFGGFFSYNPLWVGNSGPFLQTNISNGPGVLSLGTGWEFFFPQETGYVWSLKLGAGIGYGSKRYWGRTNDEKVNGWPLHVHLSIPFYFGKAFEQWELFNIYEAEWDAFSIALFCEYYTGADVFTGIKGYTSGFRVGLSIGSSISGFMGSGNDYYSSAGGFNTAPWERE